jgi:hypothetical protein
MTNYKLPGVCGMDPVSSAPSITDSLFSRKPNYSPGPVCSIRNPKVIYISIVNNYDASEGIACYLEIYSNNILVVSKRVSKAGALNYKIEILDSERIANYKITIYSISKYRNKVSKENLGIETGVSKSITVVSNTPTHLKFGVSRRESILHDFLMKFDMAGDSLLTGNAPIYELDSMSDVAKYSSIIVSESKKRNVDSNLVKAIMYMETTHGYYDAIPALFDKNKSILPMNVRSNYWKDIGFTRGELKKTKDNIVAGIYLIQKISERINPYSIAGVASLYQDLGATKVTEYGKRVKNIYDKKLWIPEPGFLEKINMEINRFEMLSPLEQINILKHLFGG